MASGVVMHQGNGTCRNRLYNTIVAQNGAVQHSTSHINMSAFMTLVTPLPFGCGYEAWPGLIR